MDKKFSQTVKELSILIGIGVIAIIVLNYTTSLFKTPRVIEKEIIKEVANSTSTSPKISEYPDFDYYNQIKKINIVSSTNSWVNNGIKVGRKYQRFIKLNGQITNAYLFVDVSVDNEQPLKIWDSVYVSLQKVLNNYAYKPVLDGQLYKKGGLNVPSTATSSRYLYDLSQIPVVKTHGSDSEPVYSELRGFNSLNWLNLINDSQKFEFNSFLSTARQGGVINNISIGYECSKETPDCKLELIDK